MSVPVPKLDDTTFEELVEEARKLIPVYTREWTDHNLHDPGMTLIDLFAWLVEMQLYRLDYITDQHRLKYLKLLGIKPLPAFPSRIDVELRIDDSQKIPAGARLKVTSAFSDLLFETDEEVDVFPIALTSLVSYAGYQFTDVTAFNNSQKTYFYAFGEYPQKGDMLYLGLDLPEALSGEILRLSMYLFEDDLPPVGQHGEEKAQVYPSAEVNWEYLDDTDWNPLIVSASEETIATLSQSGILRITLPEKIVKKPFPYASERLKILNERFWIRCKVVQAEYEIPPRIHGIMLNIVSATQGETMTKEDLGLSSGLPYQIFHTQKSPIVPGSSCVAINGEEWSAVDDLDASKPDDSHYMIDLATGTIWFGDGIHGAIPPKKINIHVDYRCGGGIQGNIDAEAMSTIEIPGVNVSFPFPAHGGSEAESIEQAFLRFRKDLMIPYTAVTAKDYEDITKATPGLRIARTKAIISSERENEVIVVVVPFSFSPRPLPGEGFKRTICEHLDRHRLITTRLKIQEPDYVRVSVNADIKILAGYDPERVKERINQNLQSFLSPIQRTSGDHAWPFGRPVYRSEIYELLEDVEGVDCVSKLSLFAQEGTFAYKKGDIEIGALSLVYAGSHNIKILESQTICNTRERYE